MFNFKGFKENFAFADYQVISFKFNISLGIVARQSHQSSTCQGRMCILGRLGNFTGQTHVQHRTTAVIRYIVKNRRAKISYCGQPLLSYRKISSIGSYIELSVNQPKNM